MKKLLVVLAIGAFAACNNSASTENKSGDSATNVTVDTTTVKPDTTLTSVDTTQAKTDTTVKK